MIFIFDENFSYKITRGLRGFYDTNVYTIKHISDDLKFGGLPDTEWLPQLPKKEQSILLTKDYHIERRPHERKAWADAGLITFFFKEGWFHEIGDEQIWRIARWFPKIVQITGRAKIGDIYQVPYNGTLRGLKKLPYSK